MEINSNSKKEIYNIVGCVHELDKLKHCIMNAEELQNHLLYKYIRDGLIKHQDKIVEIYSIMKNAKYNTKYIEVTDVPYFIGWFFKNQGFVVTIEANPADSL